MTSAASLGGARRPLVSVCMPCYNAARFVGAAIESVLAQTYSPIELIVVNDGSTDDSAAVLEGFESRGVKVIHQSNAGQCAAANRAFGVSKGDLIKFFDADDLLDREMISRQVAAISTYDDAIAMSEWARFRQDPTEAVFNALPMYRTTDPVTWLTEEWARGEPMMQCAMWLIPRSVLQRAGGWNERLSLINDFEFFSRVLLAARSVVYTPGARLYYRSSVANSLSSQKSRMAAESALLSFILGTEHLIKVEDSQRTRRAAANMLRTFEYTFYPHFEDLRKRAAAKIGELGGSDLQPVGPPGFHRLRRWLGWRAARRIQIVVQQLRQSNL